MNFLHEEVKNSDNGRIKNNKQTTCGVSLNYVIDELKIYAYILNSNFIYSNLKWEQSNGKA